MPPLEPSAANIGVKVGQPSTVGGGLSVHVQYTVETSTSMPHFPRGMMAVQRRYSDFEWLHGRLATQFPDVMLPLFPAKRLFGNRDQAFLAQRCAELGTYMVRLPRAAVRAPVPRLHAGPPTPAERRVWTPPSGHTEL